MRPPTFLRLGILYILWVCVLVLQAQPPKPAAPAPTTTTKPATTQVNENFMYLVGMQIQNLNDVPLCYSTKNDVGKIKIPFEVEDTINRLEDFVLMEEAIPSPDCFVPEIKLIFKNYTYVMSMYCTQVMMFKNNEPYVPSATKIKSDLVFTPTVYLYLNKLKRKHFKDLKIAPAVLEKIKIEKPINLEDDLDAKELDALLKEEEDSLNEDKDVEVEDKGEFDKIEIYEKDPDDNGK